MNHGPRFLLLALALAGWMQTLVIGQIEPKYPLEKFIEKYRIINDYLEEHVPTDDYHANWFAAVEWSGKEDKKKSVMRKKSLIEALNRFTRLDASRPWADGKCHGFEHLKANDEALGDAAHQAGDNYPLKRIDKVIEHIANDYLGMCRRTLSGERLPEFSYKQRLYDRIESLLSEKLAADSEPEVIMAAVEKLLDETLASKGEGALTNAMKQLASLKTVLDEAKCNDEGYNTILRNLVASRRNVAVPALDPSPRHVERLAVHYTSKYQDLCHELLPEQFENLIKEIDEVTMDSLRIMLSELILGNHDGENAEADFKATFQTKELVANLTAREDLKFPVDFNPDNLLGVIKILAGDDPDARDLEIEVVKGTEYRHTQKNNIGRLYDKYIFQTCRNYEVAVNRFFERLVFDTQSGKTRFNKTTKKTLSLGLGFTALEYCKSFTGTAADSYIVNMEHKLLKYVDAPPKPDIVSPFHGWTADRLAKFPMFIY